MIEGVKILEEIPVYDSFWMPLCYIMAGLCFIATVLVTVYCCKKKWWFWESDPRTIGNRLANTLTIMLMYGTIILCSVFITMVGDIVLTLCKFEGVKGDTVQYKVQVDRSCSFIEFTENYTIIKEYGNNTYLVEVKE